MWLFTGLRWQVERFNKSVCWRRRDRNNETWQIHRRACTPSEEGNSSRKTIQYTKNHLKKKNTKKQCKKSRRWMVVRRLRVCVQYIRPAPCSFWPPSSPTWIPAVAGIYMFSLDYLFLFQTYQVAVLFRGLGRFLPCLSRVSPFFGSPILLLIFLLTSPFFTTWFFFLPTSTSRILMCTWCDPVCILYWIGLPEGTSERRKKEGMRL